MPLPPIDVTKTAVLLDLFDRLKSWPGIVALAERTGMSRQGVAKALMLHRREKYLRWRHPSRGRRHDLIAKRKP